MLTERRSISDFPTSARTDYHKLSIQLHASLLPALHVLLDLRASHGQANSR